MHAQAAAAWGRSRLSCNIARAVSQENWHPLKVGTPVPLILGNLAPSIGILLGLRIQWHPL